MVVGARSLSRLAVTDSGLRLFGCDPSATLKEILEKIRLNRLGFCLVLSGERNLLGVVCEHEIRCFWAEGADLATAGEIWMNSSPLTVHQGENPNGDNRFTGLVVVPEIMSLDRKIVAVWVQKPDSLRQYTSKYLLGMVLAGGKGTRLKEHTRNLAKPLVRVSAGDTLLDLVLDGFRKSGFSEITLSVRHKKEQFFEKQSEIEKKSGLKLTFIEENEPLGTAGSLFSLEDFRSGVVISNGDVYSSFALSTFIDYSIRVDADICVVGTCQSQKNEFGVLKLDSGNKLTEIVEKPVTRFLVAAGVYFASARVLEHFAPMLRGNSIDMPDFLNLVIKGGFDVRVFPIFEEWKDVGTPEVLNEVRAELLYGEEL